MALQGPGVLGGSKEGTKGHQASLTLGCLESRLWELSQGWGLAVGFGMLGSPGEEEPWGQEGAHGGKVVILG